MTTVSGSIVWALLQRDNTTNVREEFIDDQGNLYGNTDYEAPAGYDINARLSTDVAALQAQVDNSQQAQQSNNSSNAVGIGSFSGGDAGAALCTQLVADLQNADDNAVNDSNIYSLMQQLDSALEAYTD